MQTHKTLLRRLATLSMMVALIVVMLGAYTRLTQAGLGCPDWPGCYGRMVVSSLQGELPVAQARFPDTPIESVKAWTEMTHRYVAGTLVCLIVLMNVLVFRARSLGQSTPWRVPVTVFFLLVFQALLGMWTVTLKLLPLVVMGHLLGGILIFSCLCYFRLQLSTLRQADNAVWRFWITLGLLLVLCQIALGGWVSSNYAGVACVGFPKCNGQWLPALHLTDGFHLFLPIGANYQGGQLDYEARVTIQWVHRIGAMVVAGYMLGLSAWLWTRARFMALRVITFLMIGVVFAQFSLGLLNVYYFLPLSVAVLHNGVAALLLALCFALRYVVSGGARNASVF